MAAYRYPTREKAEIEIYGKGTGVVAKIRDLSQTGACVQWDLDDFQLLKGDLVRITINLKALKKEHHVNAEVVWTNGNKSGLHFLNTRELVEKMLVRGV